MKHTSTEELRVLFLEDSAQDAEMAQYELERNGLTFSSRRVQTRDALCAALTEFNPDLVLSDLTMPGFNGVEGLKVTRTLRPTVPFIYFSGTIGEGRAIELLKEGATDFVLKDDIARLSPAVDRALMEARLLGERLHIEEQNRTLSRAVEHSPASIVITNAAGKIQYVNPKFLEVTGYTAAEVMGRNPRFLKSGETSREAYAELWRTITTGGEWRGEFHNRRKNGELFWESASISGIRDHTGAITHFVAVQEDITERKLAEEKIRAQASLLDLVHDAIFVRGARDRRILFWNQGAERLYGYSGLEAVGQDMDELLTPDTQVLHRMTTELEEKGEWRGEMEQTCKDGGVINVRSRATMVRGAGGEPDSVLVINTDITQEKKLEAQILRSQRLESIGTLASGVAHDLNNILTPILMAIPLLGNGAPAESREAMIQMIEEAARRGTEIVKQVLTFARGVEGERVPIEPSHLIKEMADIAGGTFPKTITIKTRYEPQIWPVVGDPTQLEQVLLNLAINARDAMPDGGALALSCENFTLDEHYASMMPGSKVGSYVLFTVSDTGVGIPRGVIDKIFDPFFTTKEVGKGTGLGLSTVLGIAKSHGGFVNVYSEPGRGTTFKVFVPAAPGAEIGAPSPAASALCRGNGELVLVVDDEARIRMVTEAILRQFGYNVVAAADGIEGLALYMQYRGEVRVVVTDVVMPHFDGVALTRALKRIDADVRIIATSGHSDDSRIAALKELSVRAFLTKPYAADNLLSVLHDALAVSQ